MDTFLLEAMLTKDERDHQVVKVLHIDEEPAIPKGQNYASVITRVKMDVVLGSGRRTKRNVIVKQELTGKVKDVFKDHPVFRTEITIYKDVLSQMEILMDEFDDKRGLLWGKLLGYHPYSKLVLKDLSADNYNVADRTKSLDLNHGFITLTALGRFHAMSKILLSRETISQDDVKPFYVSDNTPVVNKYFKGGLKNLSETMLSSWPSEWQDIARRIGNQVDSVGDKLQELGHFRDGNYFDVLNHGDSWTCNFMYKYSDYGNKPISVKFIDFQMCHISSYIWDVVYFLYTSMIPQIRRKHLSTLFTCYLESLQYYLRQYGYEGKIPTLDDVKKEAERVDYYAFVLLGVALPVMTHKGEDNMVLEKIADGDNSQSAFSSEAVKSENFIKNVSEDFKNFAEKGVI